MIPNAAMSTLRHLLLIDLNPFAAMIRYIGAVNMKKYLGAGNRTKNSEHEANVKYRASSFCLLFLNPQDIISHKLPYENTIDSIIFVQSKLRIDNMFVQSVEILDCTGIAK